jgi:ATP-binding cassette subfamily B protein
VKDADHVIVLERGKIIEQGEHQKLIDLKGFYYDLFNKQQNEKEY